MLDINIINIIDSVQNVSATEDKKEVSLEILEQA